MSLGRLKRSADHRLRKQSGRGRLLKIQPAPGQGMSALLLEADISIHANQCPLCATFCREQMQHL